MATPEQEQAERKRLEDLLDHLGTIDPENDLVGSDRLGDANFRSGLEVFEQTLALFRDVRSADLGGLPHVALQALANAAAETKGQFDAVRQFSLNQANPTQARDVLLQQIRDGYDSRFMAIMPYSTYLVVKGADFGVVEAQAREQLASLDSTIEQAQEKLAAASAQVEATLETVKEAAAEIGVGQQSIVFKKQADDHGRQSWWWLGSTIIFASAAAGYSYWSFHSAEFEPPAEIEATAWHIRYTLSRLLILSLLFYGLIWSSRQFSAQRHNAVVNRHRQNALQTFETFVKGAAERDTKDAVLLEATRAVFSPQVSGHLKTEPDPQPSNTVIEVMKHIVPGDG